MQRRRGLPIWFVGLAAFVGVATAEVAHADIAAGEAKLRHGDYAGALKEFQAAKGDLAEVHVVEVLRATGHYAEARTLLEGIVKRDPKLYRARVQLGLVYRETGETALASKIWNGIFDDHDAGRIDETKAENLVSPPPPRATSRISRVRTTPCAKRSARMVSSSRPTSTGAGCSSTSTTPPTPRPRSPRS